MSRSGLFDLDAMHTTDEYETPVAELQFQTMECDGVSWTVRADVAAELLPQLEKCGLRAEFKGKADVVKTGPHRTVYRLQLPSDQFYLKHFRNYHWKGLLINLVRPTKAEAELRAAQRIASLGLPTFEPVAMGCLRRGGMIADSFLVSRGIRDAIPVDEFAAKYLRKVTPPERDRVAITAQCCLRQALATAIGKLCAQLHLAGVEHADFHAANILVRLEGNGEPRLWLIDLHRVYFRNELTDEQRFRNLTFLHQFFAGFSTRSDRLRFYRAYQSVWNEGQGERLSNSRNPGVALTSKERAEIAVLEGYLESGAEKGWKRADRAFRRGNRHVKKIDSSQARCRGLAALDVSWLKGLRSDPEQLFSGETIVWHKQSAKHRVAEISIPASAGIFFGRAFYKCIERVGLWRNWFAPFRMSPVRKAWEFGHALLRRQIDTPKPILCVEKSQAHPRRSYLLTEAVPNTITAVEFLEKFWPQLSTSQQCEWMLSHARRLAEQMRRLHDSGFDHRDLKFSNLLVSVATDDPRIWFLDLDGMRCWRHLPEQRIVQNLARIGISAQVHGLGTKSDRVRFLKWYLGRHRAADWQSWWRRIEESSARKLALNQKRGRAIH
jgi:tRNA A-37 threonylcarbamoyl transferase component Bud32